MKLIFLYKLDIFTCLYIDESLGHYIHFMSFSAQIHMVEASLFYWKQKFILLVIL